jgi:hypothetical protein
MSRPGTAEFLRRVLLEIGAEGALGQLTVHGTSMRPTIGDGDRVRLVPARSGELGLGDIVLRKDGAKLILHRIVGWWPSRHGWRLLTKGDGERQLDPPLPPEDVLGKAVARITGERSYPLRASQNRALRSLGEGLVSEVACRIRRWAE